MNQYDCKVYLNEILSQQYNWILAKVFLYENEPIREFRGKYSEKV